MPARIAAVSCAALLTGAGLLVAGCSSSGAGSASSSSSGSGQPARAPMAGMANGAAAPSVPGPEASLGTPQQATARLAPGGVSIIYTASLVVRAQDVTRAASSAASDVAAAGGYTAAEQAQTRESRGRPPQVSLTLKVPVPGYHTALSQLSGLGRETSLSQHSTDVTQQVADVNSRVTSQQDEIAQLRTLLRRAGSVTGLLQVQEQISQDEAELEALQAQQRSLDHETTYATISLLLLSPQPHAAPRRGARHGFTTGLTAGWRGLRHATSWVLTALGTVLPFALVIAVIGGLGYAGWRLSRRRTRPTPVG